MAVKPSNDNIVLNFAWKGPTSWQETWGDLEEVRLVDLVFKNANTEISVQIPNNNSLLIQKLGFTCRRYQETGGEIDGRKFKSLAKKTHPDSLKVTVEQIHNLALNASIFTECSKECANLLVAGNGTSFTIMDSAWGKVKRGNVLIRSYRKINFEVPEKLEIGQTYTLVVTSSNHLFLSAHLLKEEKASESDAPKDFKSRVKEIGKDEYKRQLRNMGEELINSGLQNLSLLSQGGGGVFDSSSTPADAMAHVMGDIYRAGQKTMNPNVVVPHSKPSETPSDLDELSAEELQSRLEATYIKDSELTSQQTRAARVGDFEEMNRISAIDYENTQLLCNLAQALERKGIEPQIRESESLQAARKKAAEEKAKSLKDFEEAMCKTQ